MTQTMEAVFYQGNDQERIDHTPESALDCGEIVNKGGIIGAVTDTLGIAANTLGSIATAGVFKIKKDTGGQAFSEGDTVGWDNTNKTAVDGGAGDFNLGVCIKDAAGTDDNVKTRLNQEALQ